MSIVTGVAEGLLTSTRICVSVLLYFLLVDDAERASLSKLLCRAHDVCGNLHGCTSKRAYAQMLVNARQAFTTQRVFVRWLHP